MIPWVIAADEQEGTIREECWAKQRHASEITAGHKVNWRRSHSF